KVGGSLRRPSWTFFHNCTLLSIRVHKPARNGAVDVYCVLQIFLAHELALGMGYMNRPGADEQRLSPVSERRDIGSEGSDHGGEAIESFEFHEGDIEHEVGFSEIGDGGNDVLAQLF